MGGSNVCDWYTNHGTRCRTQWNVSQCDVSYVQTVEWVTSVRSVSMSVYLMLWALHVPVQHGTCALSSTRMSLTVVTEV